MLVQFSRDDNFYSTDKKFELNILVWFNEPKTTPVCWLYSHMVVKYVYGTLFYLPNGWQMFYR